MEQHLFLKRGRAEGPGEDRLEAVVDHARGLGDRPRPVVAAPREDRHRDAVTVRHGNEADILKSCYWESLRRAEEHNMKSIAFPLLSAGIHRYPKKEAATIAFQAINEFFEDNPYSNIEVTFFAYTEEDKSICDSALIKAGI